MPARAHPFPQTIILAGGVSSRMWPLREKLLLPFAGRSLLRRQLARLRALGLRRAILVVGAENAAALRAEAMSAGQAAGEDALEIRAVIQRQPLGMGDAILSAQEMLAPGPLFIHQLHDLVDDTLYAGLARAHERWPERALLAAAEMTEYFPGGYLRLAGERVVGIVEKPPPAQRPSDLVNIVAHIHPDAHRLCAAIRAQYARAESADDHYERALAALMAEQQFAAVRYDGRWLALKYPWQALDFMEHYLEQAAVCASVDESAQISPRAELSGPVMVAAGARVFGGASIVGPAYIGERSVIGNNALVRHSMIGADCEVGFTSEVARSYVGDRCALHACRVLDSIFAAGVNFSAGCTTANLRLDRGEVSSRVKGARVASGRQKLGAIIGADAFIGVDAMIMPGAKIGAEARVGPMTLVDNDIADGAFLYARQQREYRERSAE